MSAEVDTYKRNMERTCLTC